MKTSLIEVLSLPMMEPDGNNNPLDAIPDSENSKNRNEHKANKDTSMIPKSEDTGPNNIKMKSSVGINTQNVNKSDSQSDVNSTNVEKASYVPDTKPSEVTKNSDIKVFDLQLNCNHNGINAIAAPCNNINNSNNTTKNDSNNATDGDAKIIGVNICSSTSASPTVAKQVSVSTFGFDENTPEVGSPATDEFAGSNVVIEATFGSDEMFQNGAKEDISDLIEHKDKDTDTESFSVSVPKTDNGIITIVRYLPNQEDKEDEKRNGVDASSKTKVDKPSRDVEVDKKQFNPNVSSDMVVEQKFPSGSNVENNIEEQQMVVEKFPTGYNADKKRCGETLKSDPNVDNSDSGSTKHMNNNESTDFEPQQEAFSSAREKVSDQEVVANVFSTEPQSVSKNVVKLTESMVYNTSDDQISNTSVNKENDDIKSDAKIPIDIKIKNNVDNDSGQGDNNVVTFKPHLKETNLSHQSGS